jgi:hypothetical protein
MIASVIVRADEGPLHLLHRFLKFFRFASAVVGIQER